MHPCIISIDYLGTATPKTSNAEFTSFLDRSGCPVFIFIFESLEVLTKVFGKESLNKLLILYLYEVDWLIHKVHSYG